MFFFSRVFAQLTGWNFNPLRPRKFFFQTCKVLCGSIFQNLLKGIRGESNLSVRIIMFRAIGIRRVMERATIGSLRERLAKWDPKQPPVRKIETQVMLTQMLSTTGRPVEAKECLQLGNSIWSSLEECDSEVAGVRLILCTSMRRAALTTGDTKLAEDWVQKLQVARREHSVVAGASPETNDGEVPTRKIQYDELGRAKKVIENPSKAFSSSHPLRAYASQKYNSIPVDFRRRRGYE